MDVVVSGSMIRVQILRPLLCIALATGVVPAVDAQEVDDGPQVVAVLRAYHSALAVSSPDKVQSLLGPSYFMADERSVKTAAADRPRVSAHLFLVGERLRNWPANYLKQVGPHRNIFDTVSVSIRGDAAVVITKDTGSNAFRTWSAEETTWFLGRIGAEWRIVGMVIRDFQSPK